MNSNKKYIIIFTNLIIFCLILVWWIIFPTITDINHYNAQVADEKDNLSKLLKQGQSVVENRKNLERLQTEITSLDTVWLKTGEELAFITDLEKIANLYGLEQTIVFDNTNITAQTGASDIKIIPIELKITGEIDKIMLYINQLETLDYYINLTKINLYNQESGAKKFPTQIDATEEVALNKIILSTNLVGITYWK